MVFMPSIEKRQKSKIEQRRGFRIGIQGRCTLFFSLLALFFAAGAFAENSESAFKDAGVAVSVSGEAQVDGERILLGQVAEIFGADRVLREKIAAVDLGSAPRPGRERRVPGRLVASALGACDWLPAGTRTTIPDWIVVSGVFQTISEASLEEVFRSYVERRTGGDETVVSNVKIRGVKPLPPGKIELSALGHGGDYIKGRVTLRLAVSVAGEDQGQVSISGWVDRYVQAVCAARFVQSDVVLAAGDICLKRVNVAKAPDRILFDPKQVVGKQLRSRVRVGECFRANMLREPPLIEKGDRVKIVARSESLSVSTLGIAKADGARGDQIRVENAVSEKTVVGRVLAEGVVEVLF